ncbi:type I polyketide synthase [Nocardia panacis]|uniref:type I polyketide synthase n=1 Tax=Nocardia panacis TaxID=2340916 RepID=UPI001EF07626|nr:type I polyketide synthase [Nocardia panacis]
MSNTPTGPEADLLESLRRSLAVIEKLEGELAETHEDIAIVGMSCRFPGADGIDEYWELLRDGVDAITEVPSDRWDIDAIYDPDPDAPGKLYTRYGGFVDGVDRFDPLFFGISPKEAARMDPQQRLLLEVAWEALEDAGYPVGALRGSATGVYVGIAENDYARLIEQAHGDRLDHYDATGTGFCFAAGRLSHVLGLRGPNVAMDTGCSSSLLAIHQAVNALRLNECGMALAGGVHLRLAPTTSFSLARTKALAPDGRCKTFDAAADGFGRSEGCGVLVLKRLSRARRDGDRVLAVIKGSAVNHDGPASGFTVPSERAQVELIRAALANARIAPEQVGFVEAHGTGTELGDPIEVSALATVFGKRPLVLGAVKSNIGHTEGAAGVAGVIKAVLALRHGVIPPNVHFTRPNPYIDWEAAPFVVPTRPTPWSGSKVAGVSSFGMSGSNAHIVLAEAETVAVPAPVERARHVLTLSGRTETALADAVARMATFLRETDAALSDICFTAAARRDHFEYRRAVFGRSKAELAERLRDGHGVAGQAPTHRARPKVVFLCTGQGSQYRGMGRELYRTEPVFRTALERCAAVLDRHSDRPLIDILGLVENGDAPVDLDVTGYTQPALFALEFALVELWGSWGVRPDIVLGHSVGGLVAACVAGVCPLEDALLFIARRGRLMQELPPGGAMVSVRAPEKTVADLLAGREQVSIAAVNTPDEVVVSGAAAAVDAVVAELTAAGVRSRPLTVSHAFHSPLMEPVAQPLRAAAKQVRFSRGRLAVVSELTGELAEPELLADPDYWVRHALSPVRFADAVRAAYGAGGRVFLEIGPKPVLVGLGQQCLTQDELADTVWVPSLRPQRDTEEMAAAVAALHVNGVDMAWEGIEGGRRVRIPGYPFQRERHWFAPPEGMPRRVARVRPLLDSEIRLAARQLTVFQTEMSLRTLPLLRAHVVDGAFVAPAAHHLAMVASAVGAPDRIVLGDIVFPRPLVVPDEGARTVQVELSTVRGNEFQVLGAESEVFATGSVSDGEVGPRVVDIAELRRRMTTEIERDALYARLFERRIELGAAFRWLDRIWVGADEALALVSAPSGIELDGPIHPGLLDGLFQLTEAVAFADGVVEDGARLPFSVRRLGMTPAIEARARWAHARRVDGRWDIDLLDDQGEVLVEIAGFEDRIAASTAKPAWAEWLTRVRWVAAAEGAEPTPTGNWLVVCAAAEHDRLARALGADTVFVTEPGELADSAGIALPETIDRVLFAADSESEFAAHATHLVTGLFTLAQLLTDRPTPPRLHIRTRLGQQVLATDRPDPAQTALWGMVRVIAAEYPELRCLAVDIDPEADLATAFATDHRYSAVRDGVRYTPVSESVDAPASDPQRLALSDYGSPDNLIVEAGPRVEPAAAEVEIAVRAAGLNFRDVLLSLGMMREHYGTERPARDIPLGFECAGEVTAVGEAVSGLSVGDRVMAMVEGGFADYVTAPAGSVAPIPAGLNFAEAATVPLAFLTAQYALTRLAGLRSGESVLIHAAAGGVGQAAVQIAQRIGARIYATAGAGKRDAVRALGVETVFDSRSASFAQDLLAATSGRGVDVVLNSLTGEFIEAGVSVVAAGGRFVELGKLGIWSEARMREIRPDIGYFAFDLGDDGEADPDLIAGLLTELGAGFAAGSLRPLPMTVFSSSEAARAYGFMQRAKHIGKVVLAFDRPAAVRGDGSYLVTGGLGGIGLLVARRLAELGAGRIVLMSRSEPSQAAAAVISALEALPASHGDRRVAVSVVTGDVRSEADVARAVRECGGALRGVIHAAGVLNDGVLVGQSVERIREVLGPKVIGGALLDRATRAIPLDFFVAFSSIAALLEEGGQGGYGAANAFLDGLMARRRAEGLPGLAINWGPWAEVGMAAGLEERLVRAGSDMIPPQQGIDALMALVGTGRQLAVVPTRRTPQQVVAAPVGLAGQLASAAPEDRIDLLDNYFRELLTDLLDLPPGYRIDPHAAFQDLGMDSLMVVELRNRLQHDLDIALATTVAFDYPTVDALRGHLRTRLEPPDPDLALDDVRLLVDQELDLLSADEEATP